MSLDTFHSIPQTKNGINVEIYLANLYFDYLINTIFESKLNFKNNFQN